MRAPAPHTIPVDRLTLQIESLQEHFRDLSAATTVKDLAVRFTAVLRGIYPSAEIDLLIRAHAGNAWENYSGGDGSRAAAILPVPDDRTAVVSPLDEAVKGIHVVQRLVDRSHVGILISHPPTAPPYAELDLVSLRLFAHLFDNAHQALLSRRNEKDLIFSLNHRVLQLNSLIDTGIEVAKLDQDVSPEHLALERAASLTNASKGMVTVTTKTGKAETHYFPAALPDRAVADGTHRIASEVAFAGSLYRFELFDKESRKGILPFDETDQLLLDALARQVHASLENRYLHAQSLEKQKIEQDIAVAASIQQRILPAALPVIEGYEIAGINIPSKSVGGDYYDCIPLPDGKFALIVADVAGKGVPAALLVSSLHAYLSAYLEGSLPLVDLARRVNRVICHASTDDKFITACLGLLDPLTGELESINAGHPPVLLVRRDGVVQELNEGGAPFGMIDLDIPYKSERVTIANGERLLLYTDGITEAADAEYNLYDAGSPLKEFVARYKGEKADLFIQTLIADIKRFTGDAPQNDDITALYLHRL